MHLIARLDRGLSRIEKGTIAGLLIAMTGMVFLDVVHRRLIAPDSRFGRLVALILGVGDDSPTRPLFDSVIGPVVGGVVGLVVLWAAFAAKERSSGKRILGFRGSAAVLSIVTAAVFAAFGWMVIALESYQVYLFILAIAAALTLRTAFRQTGRERATTLMVIAVVGPLFVFVALRYFPVAYTWAKELAMASVLWVGFLGASMCAREGKHIRLEALERTHPERARKVLKGLSAVVTTAFCALLIYLGWQYVFGAETGTYALNVHLQETGLPDWVMTLSIPVGLSIAAVRFLASGVSLLRGGTYGAPARAEGVEEAEKVAQEAGRGEQQASTASSTGALRRRRIIFFSVLGLTACAPLLFGTAGWLVSGILLAALLGQPLFVILGIVTVLCFVLWSDQVHETKDLSVLVERIRMLADNKALLSVPFYVMSGAVMGQGEIGKRLVQFSSALFGWLPGGLAISVVAGCVMFSAISGSSPATVIAIGSVMGPALLKHGYRKDFSVGLVTSAGSLGILIPPSIPMIVYCIVQTATVMSVEEFHAAGIAPGLIIGSVLAVYCAYRGLRDKAPREAFSFHRLWVATRDGLWSLLFPVLILGGIYLGFFDDIEAACTSVVYSVLVEIFIHRAFGLKDLPKVVLEAGILLGSFLIVLVVATSFAEFLETQQVAQAAVAAIRTLDLEPWQFLLVVNGLLLVVGCLMDIMSAIFVFVPLLAPMAVAFGIDPIHFGIIFIVNLEIGYLTPPMGLNLFVSSTLFREPITFVIRSVLPFIATMIIGLGIITYVPPLTTAPARWVVELVRGRPQPSVPKVVGEVAAMRGEHPEPGKVGGRVLSMAEMMELASQTPDAGTDAPDAGR